jgi:hypothetical protein
MASSAVALMELSARSIFRPELASIALPFAVENLRGRRREAVLRLDRGPLFALVCRAVRFEVDAVARVEHEALRNEGAVDEGDLRIRLELDIVSVVSMVVSSSVISKFDEAFATTIGALIFAFLTPAFVTSGWVPSQLPETSTSSLRPLPRLWGLRRSCADESRRGVRLARS